MNSAVKRLIDILGATFALLLFAIPVAIISILVRVKLGSPVFFKQERPGKGGKLFTMYKFRTMKDAAAKDGTPLPDEQRLTPFGNFLRNLSLDELPEFINVLKGDMSLVGPRPLLPQYLERYSPEQARRHEVRPGITGWAQINGRNAISWDQKLAYDVWYVDHHNIALDIKILLLTVLKVFKRDGISAEGSATMPEFMGSVQAEKHA
jgi:lipopolysaccharide/colanic/teichoic acid biosynthesis glycosyltransferase